MKLLYQELYSNFELRCLVTTKENTSKENLTEEYYGIQYSVSRIDEKLIKVSISNWQMCLQNSVR